ncbi:helix-turn-helix domain-containing protein [Brevibacillus reuszeri]|uniref:helix-turn-helix domain-containing protein n=1 Tax=Brevibacillus reuszeri TaxID=54915 RepID=UPI00366FEDD3
MIGETLKKLRAIYGLTSAQMREELGISTSYLSEIENQKKMPSLELLESYSKVLGIKKSSIVLLSEKLEDAEGKNSSREFIRGIMVRLIDLTAIDVNESEE